jgi:ketopantoate reductase
LRAGQRLSVPVHIEAPFQRRAFWRFGRSLFQDERTNTPSRGEEIRAELIALAALAGLACPVMMVIATVLIALLR